MKVAVLLLLFCLYAPYTNAGWNMIWADEFDAPKIDSTKWNTYLLDQVLESTHAAFDPTSFTTSGGNTSAIQTSYLSNPTYSSTTGMLSTQYKFGFKYGYIEVYLTLSREFGLRHTIGLYQQNDDPTHLGSLTFDYAHDPPFHQLYFTVDGFAQKFGFPIRKSDFHKVGIVWTPFSLLCIIDDQWIAAATSSRNDTLNTPQYLSIYTLDTRNNTSSTQYLNIDYVRVYEQSPNGTSLPGPGDGTPFNSSLLPDIPQWLINKVSRNPETLLPKQTLTITANVSPSSSYLKSGSRDLYASIDLIPYYYNAIGYPPERIYASSPFVCTTATCELSLSVVIPALSPLQYYSVSFKLLDQTSSVVLVNKTISVVGVGLDKVFGTSSPIIQSCASIGQHSVQCADALTLTNGTIFQPSSLAFLVVGNMTMSSNTTVSLIPTQTVVVSGCANFGGHLNIRVPDIPLAGNVTLNITAFNYTCSSSQFSDIVVTSLTSTHSYCVSGREYGTVSLWVAIYECTKRGELDSSSTEPIEPTGDGNQLETWIEKIQTFGKYFFF